jgi:hypothetical protein
MRLKLFLLCVPFIFFSVNVFAGGIDGFDGFKWGSSRNDIIKVRGEEPVNWGEIEVWKAEDDETVSDFRIKLIGYEFEDGCDETKEERSGPCSLWGGIYILETTSADDIGTLSELLGTKYGEHKKTSGVQKKRNPDTDELLSNITTTHYIWEQADKSSIELFYKSYDKDHMEKLKQIKKGIFRIGVRYYSSAYAQEKERTEPKKKSF